MDPCIVALGGNGVVHRMMPPIELAERLTLLLALAVFFGLAFEEIYKPKSGSWLGGPLCDVGWDNRGLRFRRG
jgi:hypothetical protein